MKSRIYILFLTAAMPLFAQQPATLLGALPREVQETSGLIFFNGKLITLNDSGNEAVLFEVDTASLEVTRTVNVQNAVNIDWEDITQDETYIYLADIGNINGDREDLGVYRIAKADYRASDSPEAEFIGFRYEDQASFTTVSQSDWDAEAIAIKDGQLLVFTKQWQGQASRVYSFPAVPGEQVGSFLGTYQVNGLVTGAELTGDGDTMYLCGYNQILQPFLATIANFTMEAQGSLSRETIDIGLAQVEGIAIDTSGRIFLSSERFENNMPPISLEASLILIDLAAPVPTNPEPPADGGESPPGPDPGDDGLLIYSRFGSKSLEYQLEREEPLYGLAIFDMLGRRVAYAASGEISSNSLDLSTFGSALYICRFYLEGTTLSRTFFLK